MNRYGLLHAIAQLFEYSGIYCIYNGCFQPRATSPPVVPMGLMWKTSREEIPFTDTLHQLFTNQVVQTDVKH